MVDGVDIVTSKRLARAWRAEKRAILWVIMSGQFDRKRQYGVKLIWWVIVAR